MAEEEHEEIEVIDVFMNEEEIDEAIAHLTELKEHKKNVQFPLASDLDLSVTYEENEDTDDEDEEIGELPADVESEEVKNG